jgi:hypothetical protein
MSVWTRLLALSAAFVIAAAIAGPASAQTKLKWAHVYEIGEPYHTEALWAADEIKKRTNGKYEIQVFAASQLGNENQINEGLGLGTVDIIYTGTSLPVRSTSRWRSPARRSCCATSITGSPIATASCSATLPRVTKTRPSTRSTR